MTDDRAKRIRDLRKRRGPSDSQSSTDQPAEDAETVGEQSATDDSVETASAASETTPSQGTTESHSSTTQEPGGESANQQSDHQSSQGTQQQAADHESQQPAQHQTQQPADQQAQQPAQHQAQQPADQQAQQPAQHQAQQPAGQSQPAHTGQSQQVTSHPSQQQPTAPTAQQQSQGATQAAGSEPLEPMVDAEEESPFGGAIADESVIAEFVDDIGTDGTLSGASGLGGASGASMGRAGVFEGDDSIVASAHDAEETIQMLEFYLNENRYAIEIERIAAIVEMKQITRFPRGPEAIDGVTDLRGEITAVLDPTTLLEVDRKELTDNQYIVVLERDDDKQKLGIRVTDVLQAVTYRESQIDETAAVMDSAGEAHHEFLNGIVKKTTDGETELINWLDIDAIIEHTK